MTQQPTAFPAPVEDGGPCLDRALGVIATHPSWRLMMGRPEPPHLFWSEDTAHFWAEDEHGVVHDPTAHRYPGYDYSNGRPVKLKLDFQRRT